MMMMMTIKRALFLLVCFCIFIFTLHLPSATLAVQSHWPMIVAAVHSVVRQVRKQANILLAHV